MLQHNDTNMHASLHSTFNIYWAATKCQAPVHKGGNSSEQMSLSPCPHEAYILTGEKNKKKHINKENISVSMDKDYEEGSRRVERIKELHCFW